MHLSLMYRIYSSINLDYGLVFYCQLVKSTHSTTRHSKISRACLWYIVVQREIKKLNIPVLEDSIMVGILTFQTMNIIHVDTSKFSFIGSIPEVIVQEVPAASEVLRAYRSLPVSGFYPLIDEL